jgi:hypothetical protein
MLKALQPISHGQTCPYAESLVVARKWASHPLVDQLRESMAREIRVAISGNPAGELISVEK